MEHGIGRKVKTSNIPKKEILFKFGIDRKAENREILEYLETGNERIFEKVYYRRKPTIDYLARKYEWLSEDAASDINVVFVRTVNNYGKNGMTTDFNTYFFSSVKNHFSNVAKKRFRKKRTTFLGEDPIYRTVPLDHGVDDNDDSVKFHEFISNDTIDSIYSLKIEDYILEICEGNSFLCEAISRLLDLTRRQIVRRKHIIDFKSPVVTGDVYVDICQSIGVPESMFEVVESSVENGNICCKIDLNIREFLRFIGKKVIEKDSIFQTIRG